MVDGNLAMQNNISEIEPGDLIAHNFPELTLNELTNTEHAFFEINSIFGNVSVEKFITFLKDNIE